jgi:hypothetical protein
LDKGRVVSICEVLGRLNVYHLLKVSEGKVSHCVVVIAFPKDATIGVTEVKDDSWLAILVEEARSLATLGEYEFKERLHLVCTAKHHYFSTPVY